MPPICDGWFLTQQNNGILKLYSINLEGLKQIQKMLMEFNISGKIYSGYGLKRNVYAISIDDLKLFHKEIGFNLKRKKEKLDSFI